MAAKSSFNTAKRDGASRVPKRYRRAASKIAALSRNPLVREMAIAGVVAAASVLVRNKSVRAAADKVGTGARDVASDTVDIASRVGQAIGSAISSAAHRVYAEHGDPNRVQPPSEERAAPLNTKDGTMPYVS